MDTQNLVTNRRKIKSTQLFVVAGTVLMALVISILCIGLMVRYEVDTDIVDTESIQYWKMNLAKEQDEWYEKGIEELRAIVMRKNAEDIVKNCIVFVTEGVNTEMLAKARFQKSKDNFKSTDFIWDTFPYLGILKSSCSLSENCDAFTMGTSLFGGVKTVWGLGGLDKRVGLQNCSQAANETYHIHSILKQAKDNNLRTGFVTNKRVTGPLMAALYAHSSDTRWECDAEIPSSLRSKCKDVALQLIKSKETEEINVIMGGGRQTLISKLPLSSNADVNVCNAISRRNLLKDWQSSKLSKNLKSRILQSSKDLDEFNGYANDYVLGVFANGDVASNGPSLKTMVTKSLDVLKRNQTGYVFVVESAVKRDQEKDFQTSLWELDDVITETFKHPGFSPEDTLVLSVFLDVMNTSNTPNDILVYATGPNSHLFHSIHDETYMAHVISYSLQMGVFRPVKNRKSF